MNNKQHWETVYNDKDSDSVSWFQSQAKQSLSMIDALQLPKSASLIDIGGGASNLVDDLLNRGFQQLQVLDLSATALAVSRQRLGVKAASVKWRVGDITQIQLSDNSIDLWHDRAVLHFLTDHSDQRLYTKNLSHAVKPQGHVIIATFAEDGPQNCSGLSIQRHSAESLQLLLGDEFELLSQYNEQHETPFASSQNFIYCLFRKR